MEQTKNILGNGGLIDQRRTEPHSGWQNRCESKIRELKKHHRRVMAINKYPETFWGFGWLYTLCVRQFLIREVSNNRPPKELVTSTQVDVSCFAFLFCNWSKGHARSAVIEVSFVFVVLAVGQRASAVIEVSLVFCLCSWSRAMKC